MTAESETLQIEDIPLAGRGAVEKLLAESFEGWYLSHARRTLMSIEVVRGAAVNGRHVGLVMLKALNGSIGWKMQQQAKKQRAK